MHKSYHFSIILILIYLRSKRYECEQGGILEPQNYHWTRGWGAENLVLILTHSATN